MKYGAYLPDVDVHWFAPSRGRELKSEGDPEREQQSVRPLAGAGIEITLTTKQKSDLKVRPLAGAGIEMKSSVVKSSRLRFAPSRGRELKSLWKPGRVPSCGSPPRGGGN